MFDSASGRPGKEVIQTTLLSQLERWASGFAENPHSVPRILLLVGGPGNGKTEAIESLILSLDKHLSFDGALVQRFQESFMGTGNGGIPRRVRCDFACPVDPDALVTLTLVQDASMVTAGSGQSAAASLLEELMEVLEGSDNQLYLCCVNRGILDDALAIALADDVERNDGARNLLEAVTLAVSPAPNAGRCWPLEKFNQVAVWPMDAETLFRQPVAGISAPGQVILETALDEQKWPIHGTCDGGIQCPFCTSRQILNSTLARTALLDILHWSELASGRRWSFRDLFTLVSYLMSGSTSELGPGSPCASASALTSSGNPDALFVLVANQYQHLLFHSWSSSASAEILRLAKALGLESCTVVIGLNRFLLAGSGVRVPAMIREALEELAVLLDPALADPDTDVALPDGRTMTFRDVDTRFSLSVRDGLEYYEEVGTGSVLELELLHQLAGLDDHLSEQHLDRLGTGHARMLQHLVRDFACRLVRRSIGTMTSSVRDAEILQGYATMADAEGKAAQKQISRDIESLLNTGRHFQVSLNTTFGQPLPPRAHRAVLEVNEVNLEPVIQDLAGRPAQSNKYFDIELGKEKQQIALTFDLYKAIRQLNLGMSPASLPRTAMALLDATRTNMAGAIVRSAKQIERGHIQFGDGKRLIKSDGEDFTMEEGG